MRAAYETLPLPGRVRPLADFCSNDLSALFFDIRRDVLYCDRPDSAAPPRRAHGDGPGLRAPDRLARAARRLHLRGGLGDPLPDAGPNACGCSPKRPAAWRNDAEAARWAKVEPVTRVVTGALEVERREKRIGAALEAAPRSTSPTRT